MNGTQRQRHNGILELFFVETVWAEELKKLTNVILLVHEVLLARIVRTNLCVCSVRSSDGERDETNRKKWNKMSEEKQQQKTVDALLSFFFLTDGGFFFYLFLFFFFFHFNSFCLGFPNPAAIVDETQIGTLYQILNLVNLISILFRLLVNVLQNSSIVILSLFAAAV